VVTIASARDAVEDNALKSADTPPALSWWGWEGWWLLSFFAVVFFLAAGFFFAAFFFGAAIEFLWRRIENRPRNEVDD
jgi:hypothetical protein